MAQPVPVTDQVYDVAPLTAVILYVLPVEPEQLFVGCVIVPGVAGIFVGVTDPVVEADEVPHAFVAVTLTVPAAEPIVMVALVVP
jgi:hypothetical protein